MATGEHTEYECKKKNEILNRITNLLSQNGKQKKDLIEYLRLPIGTYSNWVRGKGFAYMLYIDEIADFFGVSVYYLLSGNNPYEDLLDGKIRKDEAELLSKYNNLNEEDQKKLIKIAEALA